MSERERLAFLSGAETMAEEIAKAVEQSEYQWAAHYAAFIRALPLLKPDEAALLRASAPPADVVGPFIDIVFDGPPSHDGGRFVEVENHEGKSISVGQWIKRVDGYWALRINTARAALGGSDA